ncbi:unnamed protein product [Phaedon cochleariae]|uniref:CCHC-type domain-containing protein n=1 Tax=Phaedon cochleariae TaxID=80249 RepID=A0A9N9X3M1_PHACE|nr:unnamed protein product [Phaedon cochleariae]
MSSLNSTPGTSDYRGSQNENPTNRSYSAALTQQHCPTKEQAIIFNAIDGIRLQDYLIKVGSIINPKNILFASRLSNKRICMYLSSKETVDKFMNENGMIEINGESLRARRLITPAERLVLSNVSPTIPHDLLNHELQKIGLSPVSPISFLRISASISEYSHILSFRRQVYISSPDVTIPESIMITFDDTSYRIFLSQDGLTCFSCKKAGHISSQCKTSSNETTVVSNTEDISGDPQQPSDPQVLPTLNTVTSKRPVEDILTPTEEITETDKEETTDDPFIKPSKTSRAKKPKPNQQIEDSFKPTENFIKTHSPAFVLNYTQIKDLFDNAWGSTDPKYIHTSLREISNQDVLNLRKNC